MNLPQVLSLVFSLATIGCLILLIKRERDFRKKLNGQ